MLVIAYTRNAFPIANTLDEVEKKRAASFRFEHLQQQYIFAHAFKRQVLSYYFPYKSPFDWVFNQTSFGKPFIKDNIAFNLSHSMTSVAVALAEFAGKNTVGVDIECFRAMADLESMIEKVCHPDEVRQLEVISDRGKGFFQLWTAKEALLKAYGSGLIDDLQLINCRQSLLGSDVYSLLWQGAEYCLKSVSFEWGAISVAWSSGAIVPCIRFDNWLYGEPVCEEV